MRERGKGGGRGRAKDEVRGKGGGRGREKEGMKGGMLRREKGVMNDRCFTEGIVNVS